MENSVSGSRQALIDRLAAEHEALKARIRELDSQLTLTSAERTEYAELKKMKLRTKDRLRWLVSH